ncbi:hypothetical protein CTAYLR_005368 [Chrysophaeum taylorii]|uniref:ATP-dependent RNA helicase n=1 Tax=Chrysophaeum taylorii TaxID=2483200 RepID=A0AAD7XI79_9STRA|nr:hypothetical protein CTAYLR_005368 [Chrysophaeum taylorii]
MACEAIRELLAVGEASGSRRRIAATLAEKSSRRALFSAADELRALGFDERTLLRGLAAAVSRNGVKPGLSAAALDWLCARLSADELPPVLREDIVEATAAKPASADAIQVVVAKKPSPVAVEAPLDYHQDEEEEEEEEDDTYKAFALRYCERLAEDEELGDAEVEEEEEESREELDAKRREHRTALNKARASGKGKDAVEALGREIATLVRRIQDEDDAAARPDVVESSSPSSPSNNEKVSAAAARPAEEAAGPEENSSDDEWDTSLLEREDVDEEVLASYRAMHPVVRAAKMSWSGATPRQKLEQWCRERGNPRPSYEAASKTATRCRVWVASTGKKKGGRGTPKRPLGPPTVETTGDASGLESWAGSKACQGGASGAARDMAATMALFDLAPELPVYRVLPPPFRDWWLARLEEERRRKEAEAQAARRRKDADFDRRCDALVARLLDLFADDDDDEPREAASRKEEAPLDSWEDLVDDDDRANHDPDDDDEVEKTGVEEAAASRTTTEEAPRGETTDDVALRRGSGGGGGEARRREGDALRREWLEHKRRSSQYRKHASSRAKLPAAGAREEFLRACGESQGVVVCGETGSGKTTQLPQFLLDEALSEGGERARACRIVVTQPRRVAAASVARRVAEEIDEPLGGLVGLQMRHERRVSRRTKLLFCTTGVLLRGLDDDFFSGATHVVLDEIHERAAESDLVLAALRRRVAAGARTRLVLMSATVDAALFRDYYYYYYYDARREGARPRLSVADYYLEDLDATKRDAPEDEPERLDYDLVAAAVEAVFAGRFADGAGGRPESGAVLVFLPGVGEIRRAADRLRGCGSPVVPLHATAAKEDQRRAFEPAKPGSWKVVLSTNVAESSVTLPDVSCVIDAGRVKEVQHRDTAGIACSTLAVAWCSRASARQRAGRAGRVRPGVCVRLYSRAFYDKNMPEHAMPELQRVPLDELLLTLKAVDGGNKFGSASAWLGECPEPPPSHAVRAALADLASLGALEGAVLNNGDDDASLHLTPLGAHLARLPVHPRLAKMLVLSAVFGCVDAVASIAAAASASGRPDAVFVDAPTPPQRRARREHLAPPGADLVASGRALDAYRRDARAVARFGLREPALRDALDAREHFVSLLARAGLVCDRRDPDANLVAAVLVGALAPNLARRRRSDGAFDVPRKLLVVSSNNTSVSEDAPSKKVRLEKARLDASSFLEPPALLLKEDDLFYAFFARRWEAKRSRLLVSGCALATPRALLLVYPGDVVVHHAKRRATIAGWIHLHDMPAQTAVLLRDLRLKLAAALAELFQRPPATFGFSDEAKAIVKVVKTILQDDPLRAISGE